MYNIKYISNLQYFKRFKIIEFFWNFGDLIIA